MAIDSLARMASPPAKHEGLEMKYLILLMALLPPTSQGERSEGEEPPDSRASRGVKPLWSAATQGAPGQLNSISTGVSYA